MKDEYETKEKLIEKTLVHERSLLYLLMDNIPDWIFFKDTKSRFTRSTRALAQFLGLADPKETVGKTDFDFFPRKYAQRFYEEEQKIIRTGQPIVARVGQTPNRDGKILWVSETKMPLHDETGKVVGLVGISRDITELKRAEQKIRKARDDYLATTNLTGDIIVKVDREGRWTFLNDGACEFWSKSRKKLMGSAFANYLHPDDQEKTTAAVKEIETKKIVKGLVNRQKTPKGWRTVEWNAAAIFDEQGRYIGFQATGRNVTELKRSQEALVQERNLLQALIDNIPDTVYFKDDKNRFVGVNKAKAEEQNARPENMIGKTDFDYFPKEQAKEVFADDNRVMKSNRPLVSKIEKVTHADGTEHWVSTTKIPRHNEKGKVIGTMGISRDITTSKQQEKQLAYMATHDTLTGLANRALFSDHLTLALARAQRNRQKFPIMLLDLDNFKDVNDRLGHSGGDKLLQVVGDRLNGILRKADTVARMGGDEFLLLLPEITKTEDIDVVAQKILAAFQKPFLLGDHEVNTTTSIGIAIYPSDGKDADSLIKNADIAMYYAKEKGRNNYQYYTAIMEE